MSAAAGRHAALCSTSLLAAASFFLSQFMRLSMCFAGLLPLCGCFGGLVLPVACARAT